MQIQQAGTEITRQIIAVLFLHRSTVTTGRSGRLHIILSSTVKAPLRIPVHSSSLRCAATAVQVIVLRAFQGQDKSHEIGAKRASTKVEEKIDSGRGKERERESRE